MNNKGFMMAELIVVASIIIITLTTFFTSYSRLISSYNKIIDYYDVGSIYRLKHCANKVNFDVEIPTVTKYKKLTINENIKLNNVDYKDNIYLVKKGYDITNISNSNVTFKEYAEYFNKSVKIEKDYFLLLESCQTKNSKERCKYSYLEVSNE